MKHINFEELINYLEDKLDTTKQEEIQTHLKQCSTCERELETARGTLNKMQTSKLIAPPSNLIQRTLAAFRRKQARLTERQSRPALLEFDSWARLAPAGLRGGMPQEHQLLFSENEIDLDLQIVKDQNDTYIMRGQILDSGSQPSDLEGIQLHLADNAGNQRQSLTDELGRFTFSYLHEGDYSLQIVMDDHDVTLDTLVVKG